MEGVDRTSCLNESAAESITHAARPRELRSESCGCGAGAGPRPGSEAETRETKNDWTTRGRTTTDILHSSIQPVPGPTVIRREQGLLQLDWDGGTLPIPPGDEDKEHEPNEHN